MSDTDQRRETGERTDGDGPTRRRLLYGVAAGTALLAGCSGGGGDTGDGGSRSIYVDVPLAPPSQVEDGTCSGAFDVEFTVSAYQRESPSGDATARLSVSGVASEEGDHYSCRQAEVVAFESST